MRRPNGSIAINDADKAQILANHFETVFAREISLPVAVQQSRTDVAKKEYVQITCGDVKRILKYLKKDTSPGPNGIPPILLNEVAEEISYPLTKHFQAPLESGKLLKDWLTANASPIYKGGQRANPKNFRPVSLTSTYSKDMERIIKFALIRFDDSQHLIIKRQHGFLHRRSSLRNLLNASEQWTQASGKKAGVDWKAIEEETERVVA